MHFKDYDTAISMYKKCLAHRKEFFGIDHLKTAAAFNGLGKALMEKVCRLLKIGRESHTLINSLITSRESTSVQLVHTNAVLLLGRKF